MNQLKEMLEAYRNGERGLPTYDELEVVASASQVPADAMSMRDVLASKAMAAGITAINRNSLAVRGEQLEMIAKYAYDMADMMMLERAK